MKKEAKWNTILNQYLREKRWYIYYELKQTKTNSFQFSKIRENQKDSLPALEKSGLVWKFSDEDSRQKMCDGQCTPPLPTYLIILFNKEEFCFVPQNEIAKLIKQGEVSISRSKAEELSDKIIKIK